MEIEDFEGFGDTKDIKKKGDISKDQTHIGNKNTIAVEEFVQYKPHLHHEKRTGDGTCRVVGVDHKYALKLL